MSPDQLPSSPDGQIGRKISQKNLNLDSNNSNNNSSSQINSGSDRSNQPVVVDQLMNSQDRNVPINSESNFNQGGTDFARGGQNIENVFEVEVSRILYAFLLCHFNYVFISQSL